MLVLKPHKGWLFRLNSSSWPPLTSRIIYKNLSFSSSNYKILSLNNLHNERHKSVSKDFFLWNILFLHHFIMNIFPQFPWIQPQHCSVSVTEGRQCNVKCKPNSCVGTKPCHTSNDIYHEIQSRKRNRICLFCVFVFLLFFLWMI